MKKRKLPGERFPLTRSLAQMREERQKPVANHKHIQDGNPDAGAPRPAPVRREGQA